ncbi:MAG: hypothetical protein AB1736_00985 [Chloroflexota bacterium]
MSAAPSLTLRIDPALAEAAVDRALTSGDSTRPDALAGSRHRAEPLYGIAEPALRAAAFGRFALAEFEAMGLAEPILRAIAERPGVAQRVRVALLGEARGRHDEGVTCEPQGEHLGFRIEASRFANPAAVLTWARHALGHAEDTLDPAFGFEPGWDEVGGAAAAAAAQARLHRLWDVSVDGRLAAAGHLAVESARGRHRAAIGSDLRGVSEMAIEAVVARLWAGPRPTFPDLLDWATRPIALVRALAPGEPGQPRPDRCPLCGFAADDVVPPATSVAALVNADYPAWRPEHGLCGRCADRYRFAGRLGGPA